jgi:hypothetical protein
LTIRIGDVGKVGDGILEWLGKIEVELMMDRNENSGERQKSTDDE